MADNETRVVYRAIANFASLTREVRQARREIRELRQEEERLNAQSAAGARNRTAVTQATTRANNDNARSTRTVVQQTLAHSQAQRQHTQSVNDHTNALHGMDRAARAAAPNLGRVAQGTENVARGARRASQGLRAGNQDMLRTNRSAGLLHQTIFKLDKSLDKLSNWRPHLIPPFVALVPIILGLLGLINPLVAGLGAVGGAAIGFASSLGRVAGAALGVIPALFSLLSVVAALKVGFGGIGNAFKAFSKTKTSGGGGGGGGGGARKAELTQQEKITRAMEAYRRAVEDVKFAEEDLDDARKDYLKRLRDLQKAVDRIAMSEARAAANVQLARENYANVLADPGSTKGQKMDAKVSVDEARADEVDTIEENKELVAELTEMKAKGMKGDRKVIMATRALTDAINRQRDAQLDLINARKGDNMGGGAGAADAYREALDKLSPSARKFVEILTSMYDEWQKVKMAVQEAFFSEFVDDVGRLRGLMPAVQSLLSKTAGAVGRIVDKFILLITSPQWKSDLILLGEGNVPIIENIGDGLLDLIDAFKDITVIAQPFFESLTEGFKKGSDNFRRMIDTARKSGSLAKWLDEVRESMSQWWRIIKNIGKTIFNYMKAASPFADWLTDATEAMTERWLKNSEKAVGPNSSFRKWLEDIKPLLSELSGMFSDFWGWVKGKSTDTDEIERMRGLLESIRNELGPAISRFLDRLSDANVGQKLVDTLSKLFDILADLADSGATEAFFDTLNALLDIIKELVKLPFMDWLVGALGPLAAFTTVYKFTGLSKLVSLILSLGKGSGIPGILGGIWSKLKPFATWAGLPVGYQGKYAIGGAGGRSTGTYAPLGGPAAQRGIDPKVGKYGIAGSAGKGGKFNPFKSIGKGAGKGLGIAALGSIAGTLLGDWISSGAAEGSSGSGQRLGGNILSGAASGAGIGALIGSVVPVIGTGIGAGVGGLIGGAAGAVGTDSADLAQVGEDISKWWNESVVPAFTGAADAIGTWWNDGVVKWFQDRGTEISTWWEETTRPLREWAASVAAWWDENVGQPLSRLGQTIQEIWETRIVPVFELLGTVLGTAWDTYVVQPFMEKAAEIGQWWQDNVVTRWEEAAKFVSDTWATAVSLWDAAVKVIKNLWDRAIAPFKAVAKVVQDLWDRYVAKKFQGVSEKVKNAWDTVTGVWKVISSAVKKLWDDNVATPFKNVSEAIKKAWNDAISAVRNFNPIEAFNKWLRNTFHLPDQYHNGGVIRRAGGGDVPGHGNSDTVPAMLTPGEFIVRKAIVDRVGLDNLVKFNSGVMSYAQLLQQAAKDKSKQDGLPTQFFNVGGLVPDIPGWPGKGTPPPGPSFGGFGDGNSGSAPFIAGDLVINNPAPEPASDSLPRSIRKVAYLGSRP